jgi:hypothetical protein
VAECWVASGIKASGCLDTLNRQALRQFQTRSSGLAHAGSLPVLLPSCQAANLQSAVQGTANPKTKTALLRFSEADFFCLGTREKRHGADPNSLKPLFASVLLSDTERRLLWSGRCESQVG